MLTSSFHPRRNHSRLSGIATVVGLCVAVWTAGLIWFAETIPREPPAAAALTRRTDAVVVLTGGSERLAAGIEMLATGHADKLFVSGVYHGVDVRELLRLTKASPGKLECCIVLGYAAESTAGNAEETAEWMRTERYSSLRLVTGNYHMRRSILEFTMVMPGVEIIPHPVAPNTVHLDDWWLWRGTASLIINEYHKYLLALLRVWLISALDAAASHTDKR
ncbi:DUF218 domain-containing protein [uncultured Gammaproteobacteria bacterium]